MEISIKFSAQLSKSAAAGDYGSAVVKIERDGDYGDITFMCAGIIRANPLIRVLFLAALDLADNPKDRPDAFDWPDKANPKR